MTEPTPPAAPDVPREVVEAFLGRALTEDEWRRAQLLIDVMWRRALAAKPCAEAVPVSHGADVLAQALADQIRNPEGFKRESDGDYSYDRGDSASGLSTVDYGALWTGCPDGPGRMFTIRSMIPAWP